MTKKCLISFLIYTAFSAVTIVAMHLMLLADVNKYVGVGVGIGLMVADIGLALLLRKKNFAILILLINAIGCGLAISSLYVFLGRAPLIWQSATIWAALVALFVAYCLLAKFNFLKRFPKTCIAIYLCLIFAASIAGFAFLPLQFSLVGLMFIIFAALLITTVKSASDVRDHLTHTNIASFAALALVSIVVLIVISQGEALDGFDFSGGGGSASSSLKRNNPYDFTGFTID